MSSFSTFEHFEHVQGTRKAYVLTKPLYWDIGWKGSGHTEIIPAGTPFDISVPWWLEWAQDPHDRSVLPAAAVHDVFLRRGRDVDFASSEFRRALRARGNSRKWSWLLFTLTLVWTATRSAFNPTRRAVSD
ncbi:conserved hypothetical protein [Roseibium sp. TrichSKD4]|uniref:DUF1353 domain-containing protein n=1 Tax=Roseibium sp. TrichSKD4 TaxID=744980 RepID=UPI0001E56F3B|nr:DUF1353 domain-containing protein [Roseibium sp. TrichSKD4]EFO31318.1 conserved hypothetical protein [Roseibium sp. TrichSKD4]